MRKVPGSNSQFRDNVKKLKKLVVQNPRYTAIASALVVAVVGGILIVQSHAASASLAKEAEDGTLAGNAAKVSDPAASGSYKVTFQAGSTGGGGGGGVSTSPYAAPGISKGVIEDASKTSAADVNDMKTLGVKWTRGWLDCGDGQGQANIIKSMRDAGYTYLPTYNCGINESVDSYKAKLKADMQVLMPLGIHVWEIGNEMNGGWNEQDNYCNNNSTPGNMQCAEREYTKFLKAAYETVHANDPQGVVVYGGLTNWDVNFPPWMESMLSNPDKPWQYMDGFGFHPYGSTVNSSMGSMDQLANYMSKVPEFATKPIWITEYGCWTSGLGSGQQSPCQPQNEDGKAAYMKGMLDALKVWKKGTSFEIRTPICWYILHEPDLGVMGYGLKQGNGSGNYSAAFDMYKNYTF